MFHRNLPLTLTPFPLLKRPRLTTSLLVLEEKEMGETLLAIVVPPVHKHSQFHSLQRQFLRFHVKRPMCSV